MIHAKSATTCCEPSYPHRGRFVMTSTGLCIQTNSKSNILCVCTSASKNRPSSQIICWLNDLLGISGGILLLTLNIANISCSSHPMKLAELTVSYSIMKLCTRAWCSLTSDRKHWLLFHLDDIDTLQSRKLHASYVYYSCTCIPHV